MDLTPALDAPLTADRPRGDHERGRLLGTRCGSCGAASWPARAVCHRCGGTQLVATAFAPTGTLLTHTTVWVPRPGLEVPYTLGQVRVDDAGPVVFGHVRDLGAEATVPCPVRVHLAGDRTAVPWYWFAPDQDGTPGDGRTESSEAPPDA